MAKGPKKEEVDFLMQRLILTRRSMLFSLVGLMMTAMLVLGGCGGSDSTGNGSYDFPKVTTTNAPPVIDADTLQQWIDEGKLNAPMAAAKASEGASKSAINADRVVVVSPSTVADWTGKGHIPGAVRWGTDETAQNRMEGLGTAGSMMPSGALMDSVIQRLGIDNNTTIVISLPSNSSIYNQSLVYWDLRYWGFSRDRIKILNGGDDAWVAAGYQLSNAAIEKYTASTYSVSQNARLASEVRYSVGDMIVKVDELIANPALKDNWQLVEVRGAATSPYMTNAIRLQNATMFLTRLNGDATKNFVYPDEATFLAKLANLAVVDGDDTDARLASGKRTIAMCGTSTSASPTFVLFDAVLKRPAGYAAMYDGSNTQWSKYTEAALEAALEASFPGSAASKVDSIAQWAFNSTTNPRMVGTMSSTDSAYFDGIANIDLSPANPVMNQILQEDLQYMKKSSGTGGGSTGGGSAAPGC